MRTRVDAKSSVLVPLRLEVSLADLLGAVLQRRMRLVRRKRLLVVRLHPLSRIGPASLQSVLEYTYEVLKRIRKYVGPVIARTSCARWLAKIRLSCWICANSLWSGCSTALRSPFSAADVSDGELRSLRAIRTPPAIFSAGGCPPFISVSDIVESVLIALV